MLEDYFEDEEEEQQQQASAEVSITSTGKRNQPNCSAVCVLAAKERAQCISAPDVMWACAWHPVLWNITQK
jgi:hypothetical protein